MIRNPPPRLRRVALAAAAVALVAMACGGDPAAEPPPAEPAAPAPEPASSPPEPPTETAAPSPPPESPPEPPPEPESLPAETLEILVDADTVWRDVFDALGAAERSCIRSELDDDLLLSVLDRRVLSGVGPERWDVSIFTCLTLDNARSLSLATLVAGLHEVTGMGELGDEEMSCLRDLVAGLDVGALVAGDEAALLDVFVCVPDKFLGPMLRDRGVDFEGLSEEEMSCLREWAAGLDVGAAVDAAAVAINVGLLVCVPDTYLGPMLRDRGVDFEGLSEEEMSCLREWAAGLDVGAAVDAAAVAIYVGLLGCVPDKFLGPMFGNMGLDVGGLSGEQMSCLRELAAFLGVVDPVWDALTGAADDDLKFGLVMFGVAGCVPRVLMGVLLDILGVDVGELSGDEMSCLREWVAALHEVALTGAADEAAVAAIAVAVSGCLPDAIFGGMGSDVGGLSGEERSCLRELVAGFDVDALTSAADDDVALGAIVSLATTCVPRVLIGVLLDDSGVDVGALSGEEMSCLREWVAGLDVDTWRAGRAQVPAALRVCLVGFAGDLIPPDGSDDHADSAGGATPVTVGEPAQGGLDHLGDVDFFTFGAIAGESYRIEVTLGSLEDSELTLFDADERALAYNDDAAGTLASLIIWVAPESGSYYVEVASLDSFDIGSYTLSLELAAPDDHANSAEGATPVTVDGSVQGAMDDFGDVDFFTFEAVAGESYRVEVALGSLEDSVMALYDADGWELAFNDDRDEESFGSLISWTAPESGSYYVEVGSYDGSGLGSYTLSVTTE